MTRVCRQVWGCSGGHDATGWQAALAERWLRGCSSRHRICSPGEDEVALHPANPPLHGLFLMVTISVDIFLDRFCLLRLAVVPACLVPWTTDRIDTFSPRRELISCTNYASRASRLDVQPLREDGLPRPSGLGTWRPRGNGR